VLKNYRRNPDRKALTRFTAVLQPTGATTEV
jgi:hypothetical protein